MAAIDLSYLPHEVLAGVAWGLTMKEVGNLAACCRVLGQEASDPELCFHLFLRTCWPPSSPLLAMSETGMASPASIDWRERLRARNREQPQIVVDIGQGYTKYTVVHGVYGCLAGYTFSAELEDEEDVDGLEVRRINDRREEGIVQLCSSPTHPSDCDRCDQLRYIFSRVNQALLQAALQPEDPLYKVALNHGAEPKVGDAFVIQGLEEEEACFNGRLGRAQKYNADKDVWDLVVADRGGSISVKKENIIPIRDAQSFGLTIGEPFIVSRSRHNSGSVQGWDRDIQRQLAQVQKSRNGPVAVPVVSQAQMALWAHGIEHGIAVNIGQDNMIAIPVVNGEVVSEACQASQMGSRALTMSMMRWVARRYEFVDYHLMTWCRDLKENYCYVVPPSPHSHGSLLERLAAGDDFGVRSIVVEVPDTGGYRNRRAQPETILLDKERILVPEELFTETAGQPSLPSIIVRCAEQAFQSSRCDTEGVRSLLRNVVIVGGAANFPGLRPRTEYEIRRLLRERCSDELRNALQSTNDAFVLNPPVCDQGNPLASPRFVPLLGGCVRACSHKDSQVGRRSSSTNLLPEQLARNSFGSRLARFLRQRSMLTADSSIFRTGGGGGEDDIVEEWLRGDSDDDDDNDGHNEEDDDDDDDDDVPLFAHRSSDDIQDAGLDHGQAAVAMEDSDSESASGKASSDSSESDSSDDMDIAAEDGEGLSAEILAAVLAASVQPSPEIGASASASAGASAETAATTAGESQSSRRRNRKRSRATAALGESMRTGLNLNRGAKGKGKGTAQAKGVGKGKGKSGSKGKVPRRVWRPVEPQPQP
mmetsp:Transcript_83868/g.175447  ORF Transcript_83868/g.175447 Transcript_83868/m.175447 type:complete len:819 (-) Transcript_83868:81-2537(-)